LELSFDHSHSGLYILLALLAALSISFFVYYRNSENSILSPLQKGILAFLRFASLFLVFMFLLSPIIRKTKRIKQLPILAVAFDNSLSVQPQTESFEQKTSMTVSLMITRLNSGRLAKRLNPMAQSPEMKNNRITDS